MNKYETIYIINAAMEEGARKELIVKFNDLVTANGGQIEKVDEWGKRRLAYPIDDMNDGYYVLMLFSAQPELPKEFARNLQNNENILRYLIKKQEEKRSVVKPRPAGARPYAAFPPPDAPSADAEETAAPAPQAEPAPVAQAEVAAPVAEVEQPAQAPTEQVDEQA